jgi:transcriptional regulator with XRE-family HTH domain
MAEYGNGGNVKSPFGRNLKKYRVGAGLTQEMLARITNFPLKKIAQWEKGVGSRPNLHDTLVLATALSVEGMDLLEGTGIDDDIRESHEKYDMFGTFKRLIEICEDDLGINIPDSDEGDDKEVLKRLENVREAYRQQKIKKGASWCQ